MIPTYLTELAFCLFVIFHVFQEGKTKQKEDRRKSEAAIMTATSVDPNNLRVTDEKAAQESEILHGRIIPIYIVKENDCIEA